jgi:hypothetical protein
MFGKKENNTTPPPVITARIETMPGAFYAGSDPVIYPDQSEKNSSIYSCQKASSCSKTTTSCGCYSKCISYSKARSTSAKGSTAKAFAKTCCGGPKK